MDLYPSSSYKLSGLYGTRQPSKCTGPLSYSIELNAPFPKRREAYTEFLRRLWQDEGSKDVTFNVHGETVGGHKFLLSTRSSLLGQMFEEKWKDRQSVTLRNRQVTAHAFRLLLEYLYTGQCKVELRDLEDLSKLVKYCKLSHLQQELEQAYRKADDFGEISTGLCIVMTSYLHLSAEQERGRHHDSPPGLQAESG